MGGKGSGGRRVGSGRKRKSALERAISGNAGPRRVVLQHPSAPPGSTAIAPAEIFDPPADWQGTAKELANLTSQLAFLKQGQGPGDENPQIAELYDRIAEVQGRAQALAVWHELAPHAFEARTLTETTKSAFVDLCEVQALARAMPASMRGGPNHRGLLRQISTWKKDFAIAPFGKPLYVAQPAAAVNPLDRFTKGRA